MSTAEVVATYLVETYLPLEQAAEAIAGEQSTGTFTAVARETPELRERFAAHVLSVDELPPTGNPDLPGTTRPRVPTGSPDLPGTNTHDTSRDDGKRSARVRIAFGLGNFGPSLPNLLAAVAGNLFELRQLAGIRLLDLDLPAPFAERYPGPQYGVRGTRELLDRPDGVLLGTKNCGSSSASSPRRASTSSRTTNSWATRPIHHSPTGSRSSPRSSTRSPPVPAGVPCTRSTSPTTSTAWPPTTTWFTRPAAPA
jgi:ribulose 1,5-bisphosphate carboxylase large subunit-like protein